MKDYIEDPVVPDENDPEVIHEINCSLKDLGVLPKDLPDPKDRAEYAAWLELNPDA